MIKVYEYSKCSTCVKALKFLDLHRIKYQKIAIVDLPPSKKELKDMLTALKGRGGSIKNLFNTSGVMYKEMNLSQKLPKLSEAEALQLLSEHGKLVKRPFLIGDQHFLVGFKDSEWSELSSAPNIFV